MGGRKSSIPYNACPPAPTTNRSRKSNSSTSKSSCRKDRLLAVFLHPHSIIYAPTCSTHDIDISEAQPDIMDIIDNISENPRRANVRCNRPNDIYMPSQRWASRASTYILTNNLQ